MNDIANNNSNHNIDIVDSSSHSIHLHMVKILYILDSLSMCMRVCGCVLFEIMSDEWVSANELNEQKRIILKTWTRLSYSFK